MLIKGNNSGDSSVITGLLSTYKTTFSMKIKKFKHITI